jgi:Domain of unknown function (DUF6983)
MTSTIYEIPTSNVPQVQTISLNGVQYQITTRWNAYAGNGAWVMDIADSNGNRILSGVPLVTGADLLAQFEYLGIGGAMVVQSDNNPDVVPDSLSLGVTGHLFYATPP